MSEDSLSVKFTSKQLSSDEMRVEFERICRKYVPKDQTDIKMAEFKCQGINAIFDTGFYLPEHDEIDGLIGELERAGAKDVIANAWYDNVGEEAFFIRINGALHEFDSMDEIKLYLDELSKGTLDENINYDKDGNENTLLIRLHIKAQSKRKKLFDLFQKALNLKSPQDHDRFVEGFNRLTKSNTHEIVWCKFRSMGRERWYEVASEDLLAGLVDVVDNDEYLYLAFDLSKLKTGSKFKLNEFVYFVFFGLDGVKKVWVKYRPQGYAQGEMYLYHPGMGDESYFIDSDTRDDVSWPRF
jgi:hypothetical protein